MNKYSDRVHTSEDRGGDTVSGNAADCIQGSYHEDHTSLCLTQPYIYHFSNNGFMSHWHGNIEMLYFYSDGIFICDRMEYNAKAGDIAVISPNALHSVRRSENLCYDCLIVDSTFLVKSDINVSLLEFDHLFNDAAAERLFMAVRRAVTAAQSGEAFSAAHVRAVILMLCVHICKNHSHRNNSERLHGDVVKRALGYIRAHYNQNLTVGDVAEQVGLSKFYFCREFRRDTGFTVIQYINNLRCAEAEKLLADERYSIGEVAHMCGFENVSYFTRTYKSFIGCTPRETRASGRDE